MHQTQQSPSDAHRPDGWRIVDGVGRMASQYKDEMPQDIYDRLHKEGGFGTILRDRTFATGGPFLRRLYHRRKARYEARDN